MEPPDSPDSSQSLQSSQPIGVPHPASGMTASTRSIGRLLRSEDFKRLLATPPKARSLHFVVHHLPQRPSAPASRQPKAADGGHAAGMGDEPAGSGLSTNAPGDTQPLVDKLCGAGALQLSRASGVPASRKAGAVEGVWLGCVVPKRHARRAVTRNLLRRQIRQVAQDIEPSLQDGLWLVRMRLDFDRKIYPSAASQALKGVAREELTRVLVNSRAAVERHGTPRRHDERDTR